MRKLMIAALLVASCVSLILGQEEYHKFEVAGGYSSMRAGGMLGEGELFVDDEAGGFASVSEINLPSTPTLTSGDANLFTTTPVVYSGKRRRANLNGFNASAVYNFTKYVGAKFEVSGHHGSNGVILPALVLTAPLILSTPLIIPIQSSYPPTTIRSLIIAGGSENNLNDLPIETSYRHYNFLGGLQVKNNSKEKKFKPFGHVLAGISRQTVKFKDFKERELNAFGGNTFTNTGFTMALGGGIDIRLSRRIDLRIIQVDYNPVRIKEQQILAFKQPLTGLGFSNNLTFTNLSTATLYSNNDVRINSRWQNNFRIGIGIVFH